MSETRSCIQSPAHLQEDKEALLQLYNALNGTDYQDALNTAISYCIDHGILSNFLRKYRAEVLGMLLEEFDVDKYERSLKNEGIEIGMQRGTEIGIRQGTERINRLHGFLLEQNRIADIKHAIQDTEYQEQLLREFDL